jgi:hypothetical protein
VERFPLRKKTLPLVYQLPLTVPDMASRKNLKKEIGYVIGELFTECMIYTELVPGADKKASDEILIDLMNIENEFIKRINHTEPGNAKVYYRKLYKDFDESIVKVLDKMTKLKK